MGTVVVGMGGDGNKMVGMDAKCYTVSSFSRRGQDFDFLLWGELWASVASHLSLVFGAEFDVAPLFFFVRHRMGVSVLCWFHIVYRCKIESVLSVHVCILFTSLLPVCLLCCVLWRIDANIIFLNFCYSGARSLRTVKSLIWIVER